jgi:hypothetical protein
MNKKLDKIRTTAIGLREKLSYANAGDQPAIAKLDKIIRGAVLVKWMHLFAVVSFIIYAAVFTYLVYPDAQSMLLMLGIAACGYTISFLGIVIQIKLYKRSIGKVRAVLKSGPDSLVEIYARRLD